MHRHIHTHCQQQQHQHDTHHTPRQLAIRGSLDLPRGCRWHEAAPEGSAMQCTSAPLRSLATSAEKELRVMGPQSFELDKEHIYDPPLRHSTNEKAEGLWSTRWYSCTVLRQNPDDTYRVRWADGSTSTSCKHVRVGVEAYKAYHARITRSRPSDPDKEAFRAVHFVLQAFRGLWWSALEPVARAQPDWKDRCDSTICPGSE